MQRNSYRLRGPETRVRHFGSSWTIKAGTIVAALLTSLWTAAAQPGGSGGNETKHPKTVNSTAPVKTVNPTDPDKTVNSTAPVVTDIYPKSVGISEQYWPWPSLDEKVGEDQVAQFVVTGSNFPLDPINPTRIQLQVGSALATTTSVDPDRSRFYAEIRQRQELNKLFARNQKIQVTIDNKLVSVSNPNLSATGGELFVAVTSRAVDNRLTLLVLGLAVLSGSIVFAILGKVARNGLNTNADVIQILGTNKERKSRNDWIPRNLAALLLDTDTNTYSLARAQFLWWLSLIVYGWIFLFIGRWFVEGSPNFIPVSGFVYTFLISLTTLVASKATTIFRGNKGAGTVHPAPSDLILQGGVIALERVQQVAWNLIIGIAFVLIVIWKYEQSASFPTIPDV